MLEIEESGIGEEQFEKLKADLQSGDALEVVCIVSKSCGTIERIRFFIGEEGFLRRSLL
jgi:hypothetical protein